MPSQDRVGRGDRRDLPQPPTAESVLASGQRAPILSVKAAGYAETSPADAASSDA
jgi:hypothetical protein